MSGLEIAAAVAGIVSAFISVDDAIRKFRQRRKEKKQSLLSTAQKAENTLLTTLHNGPTSINNEYNRDLARIGPAFANGDGM
jgi:hypothetical protein